MADFERADFERSRRRRLRGAAAVCSLAICLAPLEGVVSATPDPPPATEPTVPTVMVQDVDGRTRALPDPRRPIVVVYEDKDSGAQNPAVHALLDRITDIQGNAGRFEVVPIADVEDYSFKMARPFVLEHLRKEMRQKSIVIYCDWTGRVRKEWRLAKKKSAILLVAPGGRVLFDGQGPLTPSQIARFEGSLASLGVQLPR